MLYLYYNNSLCEILGGYHMITAKEARERIDTLATERGREEQQKAKEAITKAVEQGYNNCWLGFYASEATLKWLKSLGYKTERISSKKDGHDTKVEW